MTKKERVEEDLLYKEPVCKDSSINGALPNTEWLVAFSSASSPRGRVDMHILTVKSRAAELLGQRLPELPQIIWHL